MGIYNHFEYGEMLATKLKAIRHSADRPRFYKSVETDTFADLEAKLSEAMGRILIAHDGLKSEFDWKNSDSLMESIPYEFIIIQQTEHGNTASVMAAVTECKAVARSVISKMILDFEEYHNELTSLDVNSFQIEPVGPIRENFYGVSLMFSMSAGMDYRYVTEDWE